MLSKPKLVQHQIDQDLSINPAPIVKEAPKKAPQNKGNARFLMGLNNRVAKLDKRLTQLENNLKQVSSKQIGYRELGLTLALALLLFTSTALVMQGSDSRFEEKLLNAITGAKTPEEEVRSASWLQAITDHPTLVAWSEKILGSNNTSKSNFTWPLEKHPNYKSLSYANHKQGILLHAKLGDPIVAIDEGKVIYSGDGVKGYGNLILIQHNDNIISVYGNNYSNYVSEGQLIKKGELIASVGESTGNIPRLYFELRHQGKAQDPFLYFQ